MREVGGARDYDRITCDCGRGEGRESILKLQRIWEVGERLCSYCGCLWDVGGDCLILVWNGK